MTDDIFKSDLDDDLDDILQEATGKSHKKASSLMTLSQISREEMAEYLHLLLRRFCTLTIYVIEPYIPLTEGEPLKIPAGKRFSVYDYGGRLVISANDPILSDLFVSGPFLSAIQEALNLLQQLGAQEIAVLGDLRGKQFLWAQCEMLKLAQQTAPSLVNFNPAQQFNDKFEFIKRYLKEHGMEPRLSPVPKS